MSKKIAKSGLREASKMPFTEIVIAGKTYKMCLDYDALEAAESALIAMGRYEVNILVSMVRRNLGTTRTMFAASLFAYQPEIDFLAAKRLVTRNNIAMIYDALEAAWKQALPEPKPGTPPGPEK